MNKPVEEIEAPAPENTNEGKGTKEKPPTADRVDDSGASSIGQIPDGIVGDMPDVQEHVVEAMAQDAVKVEAATADNDGREDASGNLFNPARHAVDESGNPVQTPTGRWKKISKNAKPANSGPGPTKATNSSLGGVSAPDVGPAPESDTTLKARSAGVAAANALFGLCMMVDGDEWKPDANERKVMETTYGDYMVAQGITRKRGAKEIRSQTK